MAAWNEDESVFKLLFAQDGVDSDSRDRYKQTLLAMVSCWGHVELLKLLLVREEVDLNSKDMKGETPLMLATIHRHEAVVKLLLTTDSVNINPTDSVSGQKPLMWAERLGHGAIAELLRRKGGVVGVATHGSNFFMSKNSVRHRL